MAPLKRTGTTTRPSSAKSSVLISSAKALKSLVQQYIDRSGVQPSASAYTTGPEALRSAGINVTWKNIWCANYWEYTPITYYIITQDENGKPKPVQVDDIDPDDWQTLQGRILIRPVFEDNGFERRQKVERLYHHFADNLHWAPLNDGHCNCAPGPHAQVGYLLNGWKVVRYKDEQTGRLDKYRYTLKKCPLPKEVLLEGGRGSGKSEDFFLFLQRGKPNANPNKPEEQCYLNHPAYRVLVLRKNSKDLEDFFDRVDRFLTKHFSVVGRNRTDKIIVLSSGAKIVFSHLEDDNSFRKYIGQEHHTIWIEEVGLISKEDLYHDLLTCARSPYEEIIPLVASSTNPGGPGAAWIEERFVNVYDQQGERIPPGELIYNTVSKTWRVRISSTVLDNPYTLRMGYDNELRAIKNEAKRRQWLEGSWDIKSGVMYTEFRKKPNRFCETTPCTCNGCEPPYATHVVDKLDPFAIHKQPNHYDTMLLGGDLGFDHHTSFIKARLKSNGQLHVTGIKVQSGKTLRQWGFEVAEWIGQELQDIPSHRAILFVSPEAFGQRGHEYTQIQQFSEGVKHVLGKEASMVLGYDDFTYDETPEAQEKNRQKWRDLNNQKNLRLLIRPANNRRVDGWNWLHELMRWDVLYSVSDFNFDPSFAHQLILEGKTDEYLAYVKAYERSQRKSQVETLPKLVINSDCERLIQAIPRLITDEKKVDDVKDQREWWNDVADALRYLSMGYKTVLEQEPEAVFIERKLQEAIERAQQLNNPNVKPADQMRMIMLAHNEYQNRRKDLHAAFSVDRATGSVYVQ